MFKEHNFIVWGTYCKCGNECSILQNEHHPWIDTAFAVKLKCSSSGSEVMKNKLEPQQIAYEYIKRGWKVELEYLNWYKSGYFINAYK